MRGVAWLQHVGRCSHIQRDNPREGGGGGRLERSGRVATAAEEVLTNRRRILAAIDLLADLGDLSAVGLKLSLSCYVPRDNA